MASRYEISTIFKMIDNWSGPMKKIAGSSTVLAKKVSADMRKTEMQIQAAGRAMKAMAGVAVAAGVALAGKTVVDSVKTYVEFEDAVTKAGSKFKDVDVTSAEYNQTLEKLQASAREVGALTKFSAVDSANALDKMAMAGLTSEQSMGMLMGTTNLAAAVGLDLTSAVDMATDAMGAFNLVSEDQDQISTNMNRIADVVAKTTNMANLDMNMWFESVKMGASTFTSLGGTIEEFSAYAGTLANAGIKGGMAGNALKNIMLNLSAPAKAGADALKELGISVFDASGRMKPITEIMKQFEKNLAGVADDRKAALLKDIFGKEQISSFNVLLSAGTENLAEFTKTLENSGGTAEAIAGAQMKSFNGMIEQLKSAWQDKQLSLGKAFEVGGAKDALANLITYVQNFDVAPIAGALTKIMQAIPGIVEGFVGFVQTLWNLRDVIGALVIAWGIYKGAVIAALVIEKMMAFFSAIKAVQTATQGMSIAQAALNVVMNANPIGLIITAIAALGFGIYELIKHWDEVKAAVIGFASAAWEKIQWLGGVIGDFFVGIWDGLIGGIDTAFSYIGDFFSWIWNKVTGIADFLGGILSGIWDGFFGVLTSIKNGLINVGKTILGYLIEPVISALELLSNIPGIGDTFGGWAGSLKSFQNSLFVDDNEPVMTKPVTQGERTAYSVTENNNNTSTEVTVTLPKGLKWTAKGNAPNVTVQSVSSASWK